MAKIDGGYIILAKKMIESDIMIQSPLRLKLFVWMLMNAEYRTGKKLLRGQLHTSIQEMREAMSYHIGYRKSTPTKGEIRSSYEALTKDTMISTTKATRGMVITICNYSKYQDPSNYEGHSGQHNEICTKNEVTTQDSKEVKKKELKHIAPFENFYGQYPRKTGKKKAMEAWNKIPNMSDSKADLIIKAVNNQKLTVWDGKEDKFIPHPSTWLNQQRWEDEVPQAGTTQKKVTTEAELEELLS